MRTVRTRRPWVLLGLLALGCACPLGAHHLDGNNTQVSFEIYRFGLHWVSAAFSELSGDFALAPDGHGGRLSVIVRTASVDTRSAYWNERLRSAQCLDTEGFPEMTYHSTSVAFDGTAGATVEGELTLHGVTRPLALSISDIDCPQSSERSAHGCRFVGRASLKRSDFGIPHGFWQGGDDTVDIILRGE